MDMYISQEQFCMKILKQKTGTQDRDSHFVRACAVEMNMDISQNQFHARICREKPGPKIGTHTLRKRAQSKWTCTSHKKNAGILNQKNGAQNLDAHCVQACAVEMHMDIAQNHFYVNIYSKDATPRRVCPDLAPAPALLLAVRIPYIPHDVPNVRHLRGRLQRPNGRSGQ